MAFLGNVGIIKNEPELPRNFAAKMAERWPQTMRFLTEENRRVVIRNAAGIIKRMAGTVRYQPLKRPLMSGNTKDPHRVQQMCKESE